MDGIGIPESAMVAMVRDILDGEDLSKMTLKIVREKVLKKLDNPDIDMKALRTSIRSALSVVLEDSKARIQAAKVPLKDEQETERKQPSTINNGNTKTEDGKFEKPVVHQGKGTNSEIKENSDKTAFTSANKGEDEGLKTGDKVDEHSEKVVDRQPASRQSEKIVEDGSGDAGGINNDRNDKDNNPDFVPDAIADVNDEILDVETKKAKPISEKRKSLEKAIGPDENLVKKRARLAKSTGEDGGIARMKVKDEDLSSDQFDSDSNSEPKTGKRRSKGSAEKSSKRTQKQSLASSGSSTSQELEKLNAVLRAIGLRMPAMKLKGKSTDSKCVAILEYLKSKGVTESKPTNLTKKELDLHRRRLEREKDMVDIDVRFVNLYLP